MAITSLRLERRQTFFALNLAVYPHGVRFFKKKSFMTSTSALTHTSLKALKFKSEEVIKKPVKTQKTLVRFSV